jgi:ferric-dicitrate binding protein FerR (iron transport regulator)
MVIDEWICAGLPDDVVDSATAWVARLDNPPIPADELVQFFDWLDGDPQHRWAYEEISQAWGRTQSLQAMSSELQRSEVLVFPTPNLPSPAVSGDGLGLDRLSYWASAVVITLGIAAALI